MTKTKCYRQGELLFIKVNVDKEWLPKIEGIAKLKADNIIREGEATGHMHRASTNATLQEFTQQDTWRNQDRTLWNAGKSISLPAGQMFLTADNTIKITHDEHSTLTLPKGDYVIRVQREYDEEQDRLVAD